MSISHRILTGALLAAVAASVVNPAPAYADLGDQLAKLLPDDGAAADDFGISVAISGATAIVGATLDDDNGSASGSAYLFDTATGRQIAKLLPDDGRGGDQFGTSVATSGTTAIVGAWLHNDTVAVEIRRARESDSIKEICRAGVGAVVVVENRTDDGGGIADSN